MIKSSTIDSAESFLNTAGPTVVILLLSFMAGLGIFWIVFNYFRDVINRLIEERKTAEEGFIREQIKWSDSITSAMVESKEVNREVVKSISKINETMGSHTIAINDLKNAVGSEFKTINVKIDNMKKG